MTFLLHGILNKNTRYSIEEPILEKSRGIYLALLSASHGLNHFYQLLIPVVIPKITAEYQLTNFVAGILLACFSLTYSLLQSPIGYLSKLFGRKRLLILSFIITSVSFLAIGFVDNLILFALLFLFAGVGGSIYHPIGMPLLSEFYKENRGQASGFHQTGGAVGSFVAPLVIGPLVLLLNWRLATAVLSTLGIALSLIVWFVIVEPKQQVKEETKQQSKGAKTSVKMYSSSLVFIVAAMIAVTGLRGLDSFANQYFIYGRGITNFAEAAFLFSMLKIAGLFSSPLCGRLSDIFGRKKVLIVLIVIQSASIYALTATPLSILAFPCILFGFASFGSLTITDAFLADITPREYVETIFGLHYTASFLTSVYIPPIQGVIIDSYGFDASFLALSALILFSIPIFLKVKTRF